VAAARGTSGASGILTSGARALACVIGAVGGAAWGADIPDANRGRLLYENHCVVCHTSKVHRRYPPLAIDQKELRRIVSDWARESKLNWTVSEIGDVAEYLDRTYYRPGR